MKMTQDKISFLNKFKGFYASFVILFGLAIIIILIPFQKNNGRKARLLCALFFLFNGIKLRVIGDYDLEADLIIINHKSMADIICLEGFHPRNICWVAKKELGEIPFYGRALTHPKMILIDREDSRGIVNLIKEAKNRVAENRPIVIFPEGTRSNLENNFLDFKLGAKILAEKLNLKVQPIVLVNSRVVYDTNPISSRGDEIKMILMPSFKPDPKSDWFPKLREEMLDVYKNNLSTENKI